ncbi:MAG TPA: hypothetical protein VF255_04320 [Solirubrobacterales bacterium]
MGRLPRTLLLALFAVLALATHPATALGVDGDDEVKFEVPLRANHGISAELEADEDEIELTVKKRQARGVQETTYFAEGEVNAGGIAVKFGRLGEFVVDYQPFRTLEEREPYRECTGEPQTTTEGYFRGTIRFRGERGYVLIEAARVKGTLAHTPPWRCPYANAGASRARKAEEDRATLVAVSRRDKTRVGVFGSRKTGERPYTFFFAVNQEVREKIGITRFTYAGARAADSRAAGFRFDNERGIAFVDPPAPFAGSARFLRRPNAPDGWSGSLTVPLLGLGRVPLTGPGFKALMVPRLPRFE